MDVSSDSDNDLELSDSEDEKSEKKRKADAKCDKGASEEKTEEGAPAQIDPAQSIAATKVEQYFIHLMSTSRLIALH